MCNSSMNSAIASNERVPLMSLIHLSSTRAYAAILCLPLCLNERKQARRNLLCTTIVNPFVVLEAYLAASSYSASVATRKSWVTSSEIMNEIPDQALIGYVFDIKTILA